MGGAGDLFGDGLAQKGVVTGGCMYWHGGGSLADAAPLVMR
jgi:hypothetical protein